MSLSQRSLGCSDVKSRWMRFGDALVLRESVVTRNRRIALGRISALRITLATVLRQHGTFWVSSSTCTLGAVRLAAGLVDGPDPCREFGLALQASTWATLP